MPVHDSPVHPKTSFGDDYRYGCHSQRNANRRSPGYWVKVRDYNYDNTYEMVDKYVFNDMSKLCRYDKRPTDPNCRGCQHPSDTEYLKGYGLAAAPVEKQTEDYGPYTHPSPVTMV